jgi:hypothetical protein
MRKCELCTETFSPKTKRAIYCSAKCRQAATKRRRLAVGLCVLCGISNQNGKKSCDGCITKALVRQEGLLQQGLCVCCGKEALSGGRSCQVCKDRAKEGRRKLKDEVYAAYGGYKCSCCGESEKSFLSLDHIHNDGAEHRKTISGGGGGILKWAKDNAFPPLLQVLCMNCQFGKKFNNGICPHELRS